MKKLVRDMTQGDIDFFTQGPPRKYTFDGHLYNVYPNGRTELVK